MDTVVDAYLYPAHEHDPLPHPARRSTVRAIDQEITTLSAWLGHALCGTAWATRAYAEAHLIALQAQLTQFATLPLTPAEAYGSEQLHYALAQITPLMHDMLTLRETQQANLDQFGSLRTALDDLLDEGIQALSRQDLLAAQADATRIVDHVHRWLGLLLLLGLLLSLSMVLASRAWLLQPLARLLTGVESLGRGDLAHRVSIPTHDELGQLAMTFNQMAASLQQDREALQQAQEVLEQRVQARTVTLSDTVAQLQHSRAEVRGLATRLLSLQEEERKHIAREMHDELGQVLTALLLDLAWAGQRLLPEQTTLQHKLASMTGLVDGALDTLGTMVTALRPRVLDDLGLSAAVEWQVREFQNRTEIPCLLTMEPESLQLDTARATTVFRLLQETLTNVARHAAATTVWVTLRLTAQALCLTVQDNGRGLSTQALSNPHAFGILGMHERALAWGGECQMSSPQSGGTVVTICLPLHDTATLVPEETSYAERAHR